MSKKLKKPKSKIKKIPEINEMITEYIKICGTEQKQF
jgi:hypothetical protein